MIEFSTLLTYVIAVVGFVLIPGPATLLTAARASTSGTRVGIATAIGIAAGDLVHTAMAIVGVSAIIAASATLFSVLKILGAAYLVYLGLRALFSRAASHDTAQAVRLTASDAFRQAILAEVLNPKTALFFLAFLPQFVTPTSGAPAVQLMILGAIFVLLGLSATILFAVLAGRLGGALRRSPTVVRWQRRFVGSVYCALGLRLAFMDR